MLDQRQPPDDLVEHDVVVLAAQADHQIEEPLDRRLAGAHERPLVGDQPDALGGAAARSTAGSKLCQRRRRRRRRGRSRAPRRCRCTRRPRLRRPASTRADSSRSSTACSLTPAASRNRSTSGTSQRVFRCRPPPPRIGEEPPLRQRRRARRRSRRATRARPAGSRSAGSTRSPARGSAAPTPRRARPTDRRRSRSPRGGAACRARMPSRNRSAPRNPSIMRSTAPPFS